MQAASQRGISSYPPRRGQLCPLRRENQMVRTTKGVPPSTTPSPRPASRKAPGGRGRGILDQLGHSGFEGSSGFEVTVGWGGVRARSG